MYLCEAREGSVRQAAVLHRCWSIPSNPSFSSLGDFISAGPAGCTNHLQHWSFSEDHVLDTCVLWTSIASFLLEKTPLYYYNMQKNFHFEMGGLFELPSIH